MKSILMSVAWILLLPQYIYIYICILIVLSHPVMYILNNTITDCFLCIYLRLSYSLPLSLSTRPHSLKSTSILLVCPHHPPHIPHTNKFKHIPYMPCKHNTYSFKHVPPHSSQLGLIHKYFYNNMSNIMPALQTKVFDIVNNWISRGA